MSEENGQPTNEQIFKALKTMALDIGNQMISFENRMEDLAEEVKQLRLDSHAKLDANRAL